MKDADVDFSKGTLDMGLLDEIFIKPTGRKLPRFFGGWEELKERVMIEFQYLRSRGMGFFG